MKYFLKWIAFFVIFTVVLPLGLQHFVFKKRSNTNLPTEGQLIKVYLSKESKVVTMNSEEYVLGVLIAEMPAEFEFEALKAQSVAIRTYLYDKLKYGKEREEHKGAVICDDATHCQAYCSYKDINKKWAKNASSYYKKCKNAVMDTAGEIASYEGKPINAVFHAYSHGKTENAEDVWGTKVDYLVSVESPGDLLLPKLNSSVEVPVEEFKKVMTATFGCSFAQSFIGEITKTGGGAVNTVVVGDKTIKGTDIRKTFGLKSAYFSVNATDNTVKFDVKGYGHGVGMSQYGANYYAKQGLKYDEILKKYYTGISLTKQ